MNCEIRWNSLSLPEWEVRFAQIRRAPLLQSYYYARAICPLYGQRARWGLIMVEGSEAGLVQIQEARLGLFHALIMDRGPLWFDGFGTAEQVRAFFSRLGKDFPRRFGRRRRIIPELPASEENKAILAKAGFKRKNQPGYQTLWLDLRPSLDDLRAGLEKKWRNALSKAERSGLTCKVNQTGSQIPLLLTAYQQDRRTRNYPGPSVRVLKALSKTFTEAGGCLVFEAHHQGHLQAGIMVLIHGRAATYQVGWTSEAGRGVSAHNFLLWQAVCVLKEKGITDFDLGGINDQQTASGLRKFKQGLGGAPVTLVGNFR